MSLPISDLLKMNSEDAVAFAKDSDADTQALVRFVIDKIQKKDHHTLIKYLEQQKAANEIEDYIEEYRHENVKTVATMLKEKLKSLCLGAVVAALIVVQSVSVAEPIAIRFTHEIASSELVAINHETQNDDNHWLTAQINQITDEKIDETVSEWAEANRYLPPSVTRMPGYYSYSVAPYLKEIADCLSIDSPVREIDLMKGAQIGATVGVLENTIGFFIEHVKSAPMMLLTADDGLAKMRMDTYITPMIQYSGLSHLIRSSDETNKRKTGNTAKKIEWAGGGYLVPYGAQNADKLRSVSIQILLEDEVDSFPDRVGKDGDPQKLAEARTKAYHQARKIARISTPLIKGSSRIARGFEKGDQRYYFVPCKCCNKMQKLKFRGVNTETGEAFGLVWKTKNNILVPGSVRYLCEFCGHEHINADKSWMLPRGEWRATAIAKDPEHRSYHINALYSPVSMFPWEAFVRDWLDAWDEETNSPRNIELLQEFYNNNLGEPFEIRGSKVTFTAVSAHRRAVYRLGELPNDYAIQNSCSPILFLTCEVDVHKSNLAVAVFATCKDLRTYVIDYWRFEDEDCTEISSPVWGRLRALIEEKRYFADENKSYGIAITLVDAGYANDTVNTFCSDYASGVYPILGRDRPAKNQRISEFAEFTTKAGTVGYRIMVDHYKDRLAPVLRREWLEESGPQNIYHFNAPVDISDKQLKELTVESRRQKTDDKGNVSHFWHRPGNVSNELWDLLGYHHAAVEIFAWSICIQHFELETVDWLTFWDYAASTDNDDIFNRSTTIKPAM